MALHLQQDMMGMHDIYSHPGWTGVLHGVTGRQWGNMQYPVQQQALAIALGVSPDAFVACEQVHGSAVAVVSRADCGTCIADTDGLISRETGVILTVKTADCIPVFLHDAQKEVVGVLHAGWRSLAAGIVRNGIKAMQQAFGCLITDIQVYIGPHIRPCCFTVSPDVAEQFVMYPAVLNKSSNTITVDLAATAAAQVSASGMQSSQITVCSCCTACDADNFFSYRRDHDQAGRMLSYIGLANGETD
ncbi:MAG TPA: peptidoglycan editing factor PgeF [bacterium]|nr:peptidoglycan editing factor PgeF [bacterium]